ncbi:MULTISPECIES: hypothetical protein [unclassified Planococcus (in: firmicutes)]|uniref:hypothetical protein n=1 Tax=unclassified Planococcus (in: firmicutes) TaxID=2662419 RepID=UPI000C340E89|nr:MULTISPECIES: hypothetical protein [unclassified Planococcus (in: firmicutes)]MDE4084354.1 hypothetical protein [Planococcus maritimus]AUD13238.1 hypothetical protein CW734_05465 [Planococcus sp. MB-3u-03]PKG45995.1 hypothetical protein CXF66_09825 [Planococcus sp. Urea-trap-24]PKG89131.1 hypothetical protein CXF91_09930 [Planococcus sp. Urea-3u-39]PKH38158.1 hypothetical protein CXF77_12610 [Planococcus sp. MB-3u-09]
MSSKSPRKKRDKIEILAIITVSFLIVVTTSLFIATPIFGIYGLYNVVQELNLASVDFFDETFSNITYFGAFFVLIYLISSLLDITSKILARLNQFQFSKKTMVLNYIIQVLICSILFTVITDYYFSRIDIAFLGLVILFTLIYAVNYLMLDVNETTD